MLTQPISPFGEQIKSKDYSEPKENKVECVRICLVRAYPLIQELEHEKSVKGGGMPTNGKEIQTEYPIHP